MQWKDGIRGVRCHKIPFLSLKQRNVHFKLDADYMMFFVLLIEPLLQKNKSRESNTEHISSLASCYSVCIHPLITLIKTFRFLFLSLTEQTCTELFISLLFTETTRHIYVLCDGLIQTMEGISLQVCSIFIFLRSEKLDSWCKRKVKTLAEAEMCLILAKFSFLKEECTKEQVQRV